MALKATKAKNGLERLKERVQNNHNITSLNAIGL